MSPYRIVALTLSLASLALVSCTSFWQLGTGSTRKGVSSSLVNYLYPAGEEPPPYKIELLEKVRAQFLDRDYISDIQVIPDSYMRGSRGFTGLEQIARLYGVDIVALVSYDQVVATDDTKSSILYWTIIGAYFIEGSRNDVQTFVDTAVFDLATKKLMIRAPGIDKATQKSTLVESSQELRTARSDSFGRAMADMTTNLEAELDRFELRLKEDPTVAQVDSSAMPGGGGAIGFASVLALLLGIQARRKWPGRRPATREAN